MSSTTPKTILLRGDNAVHGEANAAADSDIVPGMLLATNADGEVLPHDVAGGAAQRRFAREASYVGGSIDDTFEDGDTVPFWDMNNGDWVYAWLADGAAAVAPGDLLQSAGDGTLEPLGEGDAGAEPPVYAGIAVAKAHEAVDNSGGATPARIRVEVL